MTLVVLPIQPANGEEPPVVVVRADDTALSRSCMVVIPPGTTIEHFEIDGYGSFQFNISKAAE